MQLQLHRPEPEICRVVDASMMVIVEQKIAEWNWFFVVLLVQHFFVSYECMVFTLPSAVIQHPLRFATSLALVRRPRFLIALSDGTWKKKRNEVASHPECGSRPSAICIFRAEIKARKFQKCADQQTGATEADAGSSRVDDQLYKT